MSYTNNMKKSLEVLFPNCLYFNFWKNLKTVIQVPLFICHGINMLCILFNLLHYILMETKAGT